MKNKKNHERYSQNSAPRKMSEMIWEFAGDFIRLGTLPEQRQFRLTAASCAWNIASAQPERRGKLLDQYIAEYCRFSPDTDPANAAAIRSDIAKLVERKLKMFPIDSRQIVSARLVAVGDKERIEAASATFK